LNHPMRAVLGVVLSLQWGCSDEQGSSETRGSGGQTGAALSAGATSGGGAGLHSATGGRTESGGANALGGATGTIAGPSFDTLCQNDQAVGFVIGCLAVYEGTYVSECVEQWNALAHACPQEATALAQCWSVQDVLGYSCRNDRVVLASGVCSDEQAAIQPCQ